MLKFTKMHGIGNDYIYMDGISQQVPTDPKWIEKISDRHFGIGSDGLIIILPSTVADFKMRIFNADGSEAKMCGNGIRCFAKFCVDHHLTNKKVLKIETLSGIREVTLIDSDEASCAMGVPVIGQKLTVHVDEQAYRCYEVSMGNPHAVLYVDDLDLDVDYLGEQISKQVRDDGVNVEFVQILSPDHIAIRVFERGSRETLACGTGACAAFAKSHQLGLVKDQVTVTLPGGDLQINFNNAEVIMQGPATTVYDGLIEEE